MWTQFGILWILVLSNFRGSFGSAAVSGLLCNLSFFCQNEGVCSDDRSFCVCLDGFEGIKCQIDINECDSSPCQNDGTCTDMVNSYECGCLPEFTGLDCEIKISCDFLPMILNEVTFTGTSVTFEIYDGGVAYQSLNGLSIVLYKISGEIVNFLTFTSQSTNHKGIVQQNLAANLQDSTNNMIIALYRQTAPTHFTTGNRV